MYEKYQTDLSWEYVKNIIKKLDVKNASELLEVDKEIIKKVLGGV